MGFEIIDFPIVRPICYMYKFATIFRTRLFKADMNSDILLQTAAIFFLTNFYLKQGIGKVYVIVDFICMSFLLLQGAEARFKKNEKYVLPTAGLEFTTS